MHLTPQQVSHIKSIALAHLANEQIAISLDSHSIPPALNLGSYEWIAAWGVYDNLFTHTDTLTSLHTFLQHTEGKWRFGWIGYDIKNQIEKLHSHHPDYLQWPALYWFVPSHLVVIDQNGNVCHGEEWVKQWLSMPLNKSEYISDKHIPVSFAHRIHQTEYIYAVNQVIEHIKAGDVYELNYCFELFAEQVCIDPSHLYRNLALISPAPFSCFVKHHTKYLLSASPERFLTRSGKMLYSQPIKGTAKRHANPHEDALSKHHLLHSEKERAENLMIVDLVRNDLARSCGTGSICVDELFGVYSYQQVHQLISTISGTCKEEFGFTDFIKHMFPMGSMTGAPKIRAMQLIEQYEKSKRGLYSGSVGYIDPNNQFDLNVVIRSLQYNAATGYLNTMVGSAITIDSIPEQEYDECLLKAAAMLRACQITS